MQGSRGPGRQTAVVVACALASAVLVTTPTGLPTGGGRFAAAVAALPVLAWWVVCLLVIRFWTQTSTPRLWPPLLAVGGALMSLAVLCVPYVILVQDFDRAAGVRWQPWVLGVVGMILVVAALVSAVVRAARRF